GLFLTGHSFNVVAFIGVVMLVGIVGNNAILLVDFINQARRRGMPRDEGVVQAGRIRMGPRFVAPLPPVRGMLPLAVGIGEGSELEAPLAVVVSAGLTTSTVLTLVIVPTIYVIVDDWSARLRLAFGRITRKGS